MKKKELVKSYIRSYLSNRPMFFSYIRPFEAMLFASNLEIKPNTSKTILDFGCGDGFFANMIWPKNYIDYGLDIANSRINQAHDKPVYQKLLTYNGQKIPLKTKSVDYVISNSVLEHIPQPQNCLQEIHRILIKDGLFFVSVMTDNWTKHLLGQKICGKYYTNFFNKIQEHYTLYSNQKWAKLFESMGFSIQKQINYLPPNLVKLMEISHFLSFPSLINHVLFKKWIIFPNYYKLFNLDQILYKFNKRNFKSRPDLSAAAFFILKK
jgi:2-polyprenyl-3-methyl-5-hydroxy-6-metoxy-1,4-benzoquinol methylase